VDDEEFTYAELRRRYRLAAHGLLAVGVMPGETVGSFAGTCFDVIASLLAAPQIGAIFMAVNTAYKGDYLLHQLRDSHATVVIVDEELLPELEAVITELPMLRTLLVRAASPVEARRLHHVEIRDAAVLLAGEPEAPIGGSPRLWNEPSFLFYTSGTTGPSKGALITQHYLSALGSVYLRKYEFSPDDVQYMAVPLFHNTGSYNAVITTLLGGHSTALDSRFSASTTWDRVRKFGATVYFGVGATTMMMYNRPPEPSDRDLPFRKIITAPIPLEHWKALEERYDCEILMGYGQTEAIMISCFTSGEKNKPGSAGKPFELYTVRVVDDNDEDVPVGETGEIIFRPNMPHVMFEGYVNRPEATLSQMKNLWFHSGDLGKFDEDGFFYFVDRKKDAIRRRGENISSFEVEASVLRHPSIAECAAYAVPSELSEDDVKVSVVLAEGAVLDVEEFMEHCTRTMPRFALPRYVEVVDELPKSITGRLQKHVLRAGGAGDRAWDYVAGCYVADRPASATRR
jgi:crotonobetaine/carnitine-CoA ligase